jgi:hypothetical protein
VQISLDEPIRRHGSAVTFREIVIDPNVVALLPQQLRRVRTHIPRPACQQNFHREFVLPKNLCEILD